MLSSQWIIDFGLIRENLENSVRSKAERDTQKFYDDVVRFSPVDTGQFRASWNISENVPDYTTVDFGGSSKSPLPAPRKIAKALSNYPIFYVSNGKPYGEILEHGNSRQAPVGMVRLALSNQR